MFRTTFAKLALTTAVFLLGLVPLLHGQVSAEPRRALVIGNSAYPPDAHPLKNPVNDARAMGGALKDLGFDVTLKLDLTQAQMEDAIREFTGSLGQGSVAVFYYAGHGFQIEGINYLAPIDFYQDRLDASKLKRATVPVDDYVLRPMEKSG